MFIWTTGERVTLNKAIEKYGMLHQSMKLGEELGELQQALMKFYEKTYSCIYEECNDTEQLTALRDHIAEEIADVLIMIEQQVILLGLAKDVSAWRDEKMHRLRRDSLNK